MIYEIKEPVYFCGDLHGNFHWLKPYFERCGISDCSIVFCGDVGLGFTTLQGWKDELRRLKLRSFLRDNHITLYFVRGNHDNPAWFDDKTVNMPNMKAVSDYSVLRTASHNILCVGGGLSIDRAERKHIMSRKIAEYIKYHPYATSAGVDARVQAVWWKDEMPVFNKAMIGKLDVPIDVICSHTVGSAFPPAVISSAKGEVSDPELINDIRFERNTMTSIYKMLRKKGHPVHYWFYGHFHWYESGTVDNVSYCMLDMARDRVLCIKELK